jgi:hypothetical protein
MVGFLRNNELEIKQKEAVIAYEECLLGCGAV